MKWGSMSFKETKTFVQAALRNPKQVSTIFKSSKHLAQALVNAANIEENTQILEIGCGTGAITKVIQQNMIDLKANDKNINFNYLGVEIDKSFIDFLNKNFPDLKFYKGSAAELKSAVADNSIDCVISSLPWTMFSKELREAILNEVLRVLKPEGVFTTFICTNTFLTPSPYILKKFFSNKLTHFQKMELVFQNIPPAIVYRGEKPS